MSASASRVLQFCTDCEQLLCRHVCDLWGASDFHSKGGERLITLLEVLWDSSFYMLLMFQIMGYCCKFSGSDLGG